MSSTKYTVAFAVALTASCLYAEPGEPIPVPEVPIERALVIARTALRSDNNDSPESMIVLSVAYKKVDDTEFENRKQGILVEKTKARSVWVWEVRFIDPIQNDVTYTYHVSMKGTAKLIDQTT